MHQSFLLSSTPFSSSSTPLKALNLNNKSVWKWMEEKQEALNYLLSSTGYATFAEAKATFLFLSFFFF